MRSLLVGATVLACMVPRAPLAQVCTGFPGLREKPFRMAVAVSSYTYADAMALSLTTGQDLFGTVGVARAYDAELDAWTLDVQAQVGYELPVSKQERILVCPNVGLTLGFGPYQDLLFPGDNHSVAGELGLGLAAVATQSRTLSMLTVAELKLTRLRAMRQAVSAGERITWQASDTYSVVSLGAGLAFKDLVTIRPGVSVPFGLSDSEDTVPQPIPFGRTERELSLNITVGISFGARAQPPAR